MLGENSAKDTKDVCIIFTTAWESTSISVLERSLLGLLSAFEITASSSSIKSLLLHNMPLSLPVSESCVLNASSPAPKRMLHCVCVFVIVVVVVIVLVACHWSLKLNFCYSGMTLMIQQPPSWTLLVAKKNRSTDFWISSNLSHGGMHHLGWSFKSYGHISLQGGREVSCYFVLATSRTGNIW